MHFELKKTKETDLPKMGEGIDNHWNTNVLSKHKLTNCEKVVR